MVCHKNFIKPPCGNYVTDGQCDKPQVPQKVNLTHTFTDPKLTNLYTCGIMMKLKRIFVQK